MKKVQSRLFAASLKNKKEYFPLYGQIELTHRCNFNCIHCYCGKSVTRGSRLASESRQRRPGTVCGELSAREWKKILDEIRKEGCLFLCFTGGEPLIREDFLEIYSYAKQKGFIITIFTNGYALDKKITACLAKHPPYSIEITLNGITQTTYESITRRKGSYSKVIENIHLLKKKKLTLLIKTNCLKENKDELGQIKKWAEELLGKFPGRKYCFKYDSMIYLRHNGRERLTNPRLSFEELEEMRRQDQDIWAEYQRGLHHAFPDLKRDRSFLYQCDAWKKNFFIDPFGRLKFCTFSDKFSVDLRTTPFKKGFYEVFPQLLNVRFKTNSKCRDCSLRPICYHCPARAYIETGNEEAPVPYFCELARMAARLAKKSRQSASRFHLISSRQQVKTS